MFTKSQLAAAWNKPMKPRKTGPALTIALLRGAASGLAARKQTDQRAADAARDTQLEEFESRLAVLETLAVAKPGSQTEAAAMRLIKAGNGDRAAKRVAKKFKFDNRTDASGK